MSGRNRSASVKFRVLVAVTLSLVLLAVPAQAQTGGTGNAQTAPLAPVAPATATATKSMLGGGQYNAVLPTFTTGQQGALQLDASGRLIVNLGSGTISLPSGASTSANQDTANTALAAILAKLTSDPSTATLQGTTNTDLGPPGATACSTDTGSCSLNALLQRLAQRLTTVNTTLATPAQETGGNLATIATNTAAGIARTQNATAASGGIPSTARLASAAASTNATNVKTSAGRIYSVQGYNTAGYAIYLVLYDSATNPPVPGTTTIRKKIPIPPGVAFAFDWPVGMSFANGIGYAFTKLPADADTTALVAADILQFNMDYF